MKPITAIISFARLRFLRSEIDRILTYSMLFSLALVAARILYTRESTFMYMPWNLFLAYIPYIMLNLSKAYIEKPKRNLAFTFVFACWLLFVPNAFYMITDLFHLYFRENVPIWLDLILLMSFAWNGVILGFLSIRQMEKLLARKLLRLPEGLFVSAMMFLNAFGVYLGRYLRFNSWDIVADPLKLAAEMLLLVFNPWDYRGAWAMIVSFTILMTIIYQMLKKLSKQLS